MTVSEVKFYSSRDIANGCTSGKWVHKHDFEMVSDQRDTAQIELAALREELAVANHEIESRISAEVGAIEALQAAEQRNVELLKLLRSASIDYASCLESGYDRITMLGGDCDSVSKMLADNPNYTRYCAALKPTESGASE